MRIWAHRHIKCLGISMVIIDKTVPSMDSDLLEARSLSECIIVLCMYVLVLYDKIQDLKTCVEWSEQTLLSYLLKFQLAVQRCDKRSTQGPTPNSLAPFKVTTGGRRYAAIYAELDRVSNLCSGSTFTSTSTLWSSHDSTTRLIDTTAGLCLAFWKLRVALLKSYKI